MITQAPNPIRVQPMTREEFEQLSDEALDALDEAEYRATHPPRPLSPIAAFKDAVKRRLLGGSDDTH